MLVGALLVAAAAAMELMMLLLCNCSLNFDRAAVVAGRNCLPAVEEEEDCGDMLEGIEDDKVPKPT